MKIIARIQTDFKEKFGIPRQSGLLRGAIGRIVFEKEYRIDASLYGIEGYSHLWLIWNFSEVERDTWSPTVRPPRLGGNKRMGVFATRSPFRPNPIGLSSVRLLEVRKTENEGTVLIVEGADMLDGTPIYDIKPYLAFTDAHPDAIGGFADHVKENTLKVHITDEQIAFLGDSADTVIQMLEGDPHPHYKTDPEREYGMIYGCFDVKFKINGDTLTVTKISKI